MKKLVYCDMQQHILIPNIQYITYTRKLPISLKIMQLMH